MGLSFWHILILVLVIVLLFGRGKISDLMGDMARGIKSFKKGLQDDDSVTAEHREAIDVKATPANRPDEAAKG